MPSLDSDFKNTTKDQSLSSFLPKIDVKAGGRVKSISFHPNRSWVLLALYSGTVLIWDYALQCQVDKYENFHDGT